VGKAASLMESILVNHPFIDRNKRTGYAVTRLFLINNGFDISASQDEKYEFVMRIASGKMDFDQIAEWLSKYLTGIGT
jgi:death-on-curing protein